MKVRKGRLSTTSTFSLSSPDTHYQQTNFFFALPLTLLQELHRFNLCDTVPLSSVNQYRLPPLANTRTCPVEPPTVTLRISVRPKLVTPRAPKEEFIRNYKPSDWELLSREEQLQIAIARIHQEEDDTLAAQILVNKALREYKEYKREQKLRMSTSSITASANPNTSAGVPDNHSAVDPIGNPDDTSVDKLDELLNYQGAPLPLEDRVRQLSMLQIKKKTAETTDYQITNDSQNKTRDEAMDLDDPSTSLEDTPKRPNSPDIVTLSKKERIRLLIKEHIAIWKKFKLKKPSGATPELRTILHQAQDSQKALQKLITKEELEGYVKGWNPWDAKRELFPPPAVGRYATLRFWPKKRSVAALFFYPKTVVLAVF
ncbi:hypothetical protein PGTUg99_007644 [Puccinia graminis f. sp. tritici]|uniref:Uncharacterized protein n=1 Tax=Puccinia graminis f. sp. tritici TaxID=56615 RepID=A0A5B0SAT2_PUCGR|nr:hypothetical protein PGTUg99_007644 [Puccinia graminis f. sp. tritici]